MWTSSPAWMKITYSPDSKIKMGDHPVIWSNKKYKAKNIYIFMGHSPVLFESECVQNNLQKRYFLGCQEIIKTFMLNKILSLLLILVDSAIRFCPEQKVGFGVPGKQIFLPDYVLKMKMLRTSLLRNLKSQMMASRTFPMNCKGPSMR